MLEEGDVKQPLEEERSVTVAKEEPGEHGKGHYEERPKNNAILKL